MSEMVERVAKVLASRNSDAKWTWYLNDARAVIEAMREPTEAMCKAQGTNNLGSPDNVSGYLDCWSADDVWRAMIDAALKP